MIRIALAVITSIFVVGLFLTAADGATPPPPSRTYQAGTPERSITLGGDSSRGSRAAAPAPRPTTRVAAPTPRPTTRVVAPAPRPTTRVAAPTPRPTTRVIAPAPRPTTRIAAPTPRPVTRIAAPVAPPRLAPPAPVVRRIFEAGTPERSPLLGGDSTRSSIVDRLARRGIAAGGLPRGEGLRDSLPLGGGGIRSNLVDRLRRRTAGEPDSPQVEDTAEAAVFDNVESPLASVPDAPPPGNVARPSLPPAGRQPASLADSLVRNDWAAYQRYRDLHDASVDRARRALQHSNGIYERLRAERDEAAGRGDYDQERRLQGMMGYEADSMFNVLDKYDEERTAALRKLEEDAVSPLTVINAILADDQAAASPGRQAQTPANSGNLNR